MFAFTWAISLSLTGAYSKIFLNPNIIQKIFRLITKIDFYLSSYEGKVDGFWDRGSLMAINKADREK